MSVRRRLTALIAAASLGWVGLAVGVVLPAAQAVAAPTADRAPQDPETYYSGTDGLVGADLANRLHTIIKGHTTVSYTPGVWGAMEVLDEDPADSTRLISFYSGTSLRKVDRCGSSCPVNGWNREHTWPQSHGNFGTSQGPGTDLHHMRPEFGTTNSSRGNLDFDNGGASTVPNCALCKRDGDSFEPRDAVKGDVARGLFYMAVRYDGDDQWPDFKMNDRTCNGSGPANLGKLSTLVSWSLADPPDAGERARNDLVDDVYQHNRNPFIDHPEWVTTIYGDGVGLGPACGSTSGSDTLPGGGTANRAPTTSPMAATTVEDTSTTVPLVADDADNDPLTWTIAQAPSHGTASIAGAVLTYVPTANYFGGDVVGVTVSDGRGGTASTTVSLTVTSVNDVPSAFDVAASTPRNVAKQITLAGFDADGDTLTYAIASQPAHGTVTVDGSTATYTPATDYTGDDSFTYRAGDGTAQSAPATVSVAVTAPEQSAPTATPLSVETPEDQTVVFPLTGSDPDGDPITFAIASHPTHGTLGVSGDQATYTPALDYNGADSFTFTASDATATSTPATASITVTAVNDAPVAVPSSATTAEDTATTVTLSGTDVDGDDLTYALAEQPAHGAVTLSGAEATYTPAADYNGSDSFTWTVTDGLATSVGSATFTVTPVNDAPTAGAVSATTTEDGNGVTIPLAGADVDEDLLTYALGAGAANGTVEVAGATATYTPTPGFHGQDTFTYTASDADLTSAAATVTITVTPINHAPTISPVVLQTTAGSPVTTTLEPTDEDGDPVTIKEVSQPENGSVIFSGLAVTYTPETRSGTETFLVTVADDEGATATAQVEVEIKARTALLQVAAGDITRGSRTTVTVAATGPAGPTPTGTITLTDGAVILGTATLDADGIAAVSVTPGVAGETSWAAVYGGDELFAPTTSPVASVTVARSAARLRFSSGKLKRGRPGVVKVAIRTVGDAAATGKVRLSIGLRTFKAKTKQGVATFKIAKLPRKPKLKVAARYTGDSQYVAAAATHRYKLKK